MKKNFAKTLLIHLFCGEISNGNGKYTPCVSFYDMVHPFNVNLQILHEMIKEIL